MGQRITLNRFAEWLDMTRALTVDAQYFNVQNRQGNLVQEGETLFTSLGLADLERSALRTLQRGRRYGPNGDSPRPHLGEANAIGNAG